MPIPEHNENQGMNPWLLIVPGVIGFALLVAIGLGVFAAYQYIRANERQKREAEVAPVKPTVVFPERTPPPVVTPTGAPEEEPPPARKPGGTTISGGVVNGKAISLPKPTYPPSARAVHAAGMVIVQVIIDENGDVISASALSGHPLLRATAVSAARNAKFNPTQLGGKPVKVSGTISYNFTE
ncbi:MAG: TonB family protein [Pyrinomonadaceae bacterium]